MRILRIAHQIPQLGQRGRIVFRLVQAIELEPIRRDLIDLFLRGAKADLHLERRREHLLQIGARDYFLFQRGVAEQNLGEEARGGSRGVVVENLVDPRHQRVWRLNDFVQLLTQEFFVGRFDWRKIFLSPIPPELPGGHHAGRVAIAGGRGIGELKRLVDHRLHCADHAQAELRIEPGLFENPDGRGNTVRTQVLAPYERERSDRLGQRFPLLGIGQLIVEVGNFQRPQKRQAADIFWRLGMILQGRQGLLDLLGRAGAKIGCRAQWLRVVLEICAC